MQVRSKRKSTLIGNPFEQRAEDAKIFSGYHVGVKLCQFPKMRHISRKDLLGKQFSLMQKRYGTKDFSFHPMTYVLPEDYKNLVKIMAARYVVPNFIFIFFFTFYLYFFESSCLISSTSTLWQNLQNCIFHPGGRMMM